MSEEVTSHGVRIASVEKEVSNIRSDITGLKSDVRGLGSILSRIEAGVSAAQQRFDDDKQASRINPIAMATILISIISILVGGSWLISGELSRQDERSSFQQKMLDHIEQRQWDAQGDGGKHDSAPAATL